MAFIEADHDDELTPQDLRRRGLREALRAEFELRRGARRGAARARNAIRDLVDAFLHDRHGNAQLFTRAHQIGRLLSETQGCPWTAGPQQYVLECPIYALHRGAAHSLAMTQTCICSICGKGDFECNHVPGRVYNGERCYSVVESISHVDHVALTASPDFLYTWHQPQQVSTESLVERGIIHSVGDPAYCGHCQGCSGYPTQDELDPAGRLRRLRVRQPETD